MFSFDGIYDFIVQANKDMPILTTVFGSAASIGFGGLIWYLPSKLWKVIKRSCFVELIISPSSNTSKICAGKVNAACDRLQEWVFAYKGIKFSRVSQYKGIDSDTYENIYGIGFGTHYVFWKGRPYAITFEQLRINTTSNVGDSKIPVEIRIRTIGNNNQSIIDLIEEIIPKETKGTFVHTHCGDGKGSSNYLRPRKLESIITTNGLKERILDTIDKFIANEKWYRERNINHVLGMLFYGKPGTGKTSLIKALATKYEYTVELVSLSNITEYQLLNVFSIVSSKTIIVLEDIDCVAVTNNRENIVGTTNNSFDYKITLSDLLNVIDGVNSVNDCIIIATTNHIEKLDPAILRAGRFGYHFEFDYFGYEEIQEYTKLIYDSEIEDLPKDCKKIAPCDLQQFIFGHIDNKEGYEKAVLEYINEKGL